MCPALAGAVDLGRRAVAGSRCGGAANARQAAGARTERLSRKSAQGTLKANVSKDPTLAATASWGSTSVLACTAACATAEARKPSSGVKKQSARAL